MSAEGITKIDDVNGELLAKLMNIFAECVSSHVVESLLEFKPIEAIVEEPWRLLNLEQAASRLGRSTRWVRERVKRGQLPHVRLDGGALAFEVADLQAFATARRIA